MQKWVCGCLMAAMMLAGMFYPVKANNITVSAASAILMVAETGEVLFEKDADTPSAMASTTKLMTALVAAESGEWSRVVTVTADMTAVEGTSLGLRAGDTLTLQDTVCAMLLCSGNDAANAVALTLSDSLPTFAEKMNRKAAQLGMTASHFVTPSGLDAEEHATTARDMARLGIAVVNQPVLAEMCAQKQATIHIGTRPVTVTNHNRLLSLYDGAIGLKTGFTKKSGRCLVSAARRNGVTLVAVTLDDGNDWQDHMALFDYGFARRRCASFPEVSLPTLPVAGGVESETTLQFELPEPLVIPTEQEMEITVTIYLPRFLFAPVCKGDAVGAVVYTAKGEQVAVQPICAVTAVAARPLPSRQELFLRYWQLLWKALLQ